jgi:hypothetical protein
MLRYLKPIASALSQFVSKFGKNTAGRSVYFGLYTYGDYKGGKTDEIDGKPEIELQEASPGLVAKFENLARNLKSHGLPYGDDQRDLPEAPYRALIDASQTSWRPEAGIRLIVHIADHGNREAGGPALCGSKSTLQETVRDEDVVAALENANIGYIPIAVLGTPGGPERKECRQKFREQAERLARALKARGFPLKTTYNVEREEESTSDREGKILRALEQSVEVSTTGLLIIERERIAGMKQTVVQGYIRPFADASDLKTLSALTYWVAMPGPDDVNRLRRATEAICNAFTHDEAASTVVRNFHTNLLTALDITSGDKSTSPGELLAKRMFIPLFHLSPLLSRPWHQIEQILNSPEKEDKKRVAEWSEGFCKKVYLLGQVTDGVRATVEPVRGLKGSYAVPREKERPYNWSFDPGQGLVLYYVPIEYLP